MHPSCTPCKLTTRLIALRTRAFTPVSTMRLAFFCIFFSPWLIACQAERPPYLPGTPSGEARGDGELVDFPTDPEGPPSLGTPGVCGNEVLQALEDPPNLYFVLDRSGSMTDPTPGFPGTKLEASRKAIEDVLREVGHRVQYGAAVFPYGASAGCGTGAEVFFTRPGDALSTSTDGYGPILDELMRTLRRFDAAGGTPAAATLDALAPTLSALPGTTYVLLFTDGAPNCNLSATCSPDQCILDLSQVPLDDGRVCGLDAACCEEPVTPHPGANCIDPNATVATQFLADLGVRTYVIGLPGAAPYADTLNLMAEAGGTARSGGTAYYAANSTDALLQSLSSITLNLALSCEIHLQEPPPDPELVNLYFDSTLVESNADDGWTYVGGQNIELHGAACDQLMSGKVRQVQVVSGCPTVVR